MPRRESANAPARETSLAITELKGSVRLNVHVQPRASRTEIAGVHGTALKVRLHAPPVDGAANDELIDFLSKRLNVPKKSISILAGQSSRAKIIEIAGVSPASVHALAEGAGIK
jgi:uncharacterized protein